MSLQIDFSEIRKLQKRLEDVAGSKFQRGMRRAFNSTIRGSKTEAKRAIASRYNISQKRIAKDLRITKVKISDLEFTVEGDRQPPTLASFSGTSERKTGVGARLLKKGGRKLYRGAWLGQGLAGERLGGPRLALRRIKGKAKRRTTKGRYAGTGILRQPIAALYGPSIGAMLEHDQTVERLVSFAADKYEAELLRQLKVALRG